MTFDDFCDELIKRGYLQRGEWHYAYAFTPLGEMRAAELLQLEGEYMRELAAFVQATLGGTGG